MSGRNVTVALSIAVKVEGDAPVQDVGQTVVALVDLNLTRRPFGTRTIVTPLRVELERAHEQGTG